MPELVAILHSFVGLAAVLLALTAICIMTREWHRFWSILPDGSVPRYLHRGGNVHGFGVAFGKLCGKISSKPLMLPNRTK